MRKIGVPIPMQVLLVVIGIPLSIYLKLADEHGVAEVGNVPQGLPHVSLPDLGLAQHLIFDSLIIAIVGFGFTLSMAKLIAKKFGYSLNGNQELFAEVMTCFSSIRTTHPVLLKISTMQVWTPDPDPFSWTT